MSRQGEHTKVNRSRLIPLRVALPATTFPITYGSVDPQRGATPPWMKSTSFG